MKQYTIAFDELMNAIYLNVFKEKPTITMMVSSPSQMARTLMGVIMKCVRQVTHEKGK